MNRFLAEGGIGVAVAVNRAGYIDVGYLVRKAYEGPADTRGVYVGFGFRY
jgi:hypothetical protein